MNPAATALIALILPAIPGLIVVAQILIKDGPHKMIAVLEAIKAMLAHATPNKSAPDTPVTELLTDDQLRIIVETILVEQKRTGAIPTKIIEAGVALRTQQLIVPSPLPIALIKPDK